jgi:hypothetical protein
MFEFQMIREVNWPERAADHLCPSNTEDKDVRMCTSIAPYAFLVYKQTNLPRCVEIRYLCLGQFMLSKFQFMLDHSQLGKPMPRFVLCIS